MPDATATPAEQVSGPFRHAWQREVFVAQGALTNMRRLVKRMELDPTTADARVAAAQLELIAREAGSLAAELTNETMDKNVG